VVVFSAKVAVTAWIWLIFTKQAAVPVQAPLQPVKVEPVAAVAPSVTMVPLAQLAVQVVGQLIPATVLKTVPLPVPASVTVSAYVVVCACAPSAAAQQAIASSNLRIMSVPFRP
jgi:hypothetical protein